MKRVYVATVEIEMFVVAENARTTQPKSQTTMKLPFGVQ